MKRFLSSAGSAAAATGILPATAAASSPASIDSAEQLAGFQSATTPSLRVPATAANRPLLRWLRAAELAAWQDADSSERRALRLFHS